jgi:hypothetical protein
MRRFEQERPKALNLAALDRRVAAKLPEPIARANVRSSPRTCRMATSCFVPKGDSSPGGARASAHANLLHQESRVDALSPVNDLTYFPDEIVNGH